MKRIPFLSVSILFLQSSLLSQTSYNDSLKVYIDKYVAEHEVVTGENKKKLQFYPVSEKNRVLATFKKADDPVWFNMPATGRTTQVFRVYGTIEFKWNDTLVKLNIYQSQELLSTDFYKNTLSLFFTDLTTGVETYTGGRYLDLSVTDIKNDQVLIDFNKAYNPYCAYSDKYSCPIPPKENRVAVSIRAGEKAYGNVNH